MEIIINRLPGHFDLVFRRVLPSLEKQAKALIGMSWQIGLAVEQSAKVENEKKTLVDSLLTLE